MVINVCMHAEKLVLPNKEDFNIMQHPRSYNVCSHSQGCGLFLPQPHDVQSGEREDSQPRKYLYPLAFYFRCYSAQYSSLSLFVFNHGASKDPLCRLWHISRRLRTHVCLLWFNMTRTFISQTQMSISLLQVVHRHGQ